MFVRVALLAPLAWSSLACGGSAPGRVPVAALASTREAQEAFRPLRQRWISGDRAYRAKLEPNLAWFAGHYPNDALARVAKVYLAWIAIDRGDLDRARQLIATVLDGTAGTTADIAAIAEGAIERRRGDPSRALETLEPLVGKLIDVYARELLAEEIVRSALEAHRWFEAVAYMDLWLSGGQEDERAVRGEVDKALAQVPVEVLDSLLRAMTSDRQRAGYGPEIKRALFARLTEVAVERGDTRLARRIIESGAAHSSTLGEDQAEGLAELASSGGVVRVEGRTVGLLLSLGTDEARARVADALSGVMDALDLPRNSDPADDHVRLVVRASDGDGARSEVELAALAADGAAILIAGQSPEEATVALRFAERSRIPILLLSVPDHPEKNARFSFVLGEKETSFAPELERALSSAGASTILPVGTIGEPLGSEGPRLLGTVSCDQPAPRAGEPRFPVESWRESKVSGLLLLGDAACSRAVLEDVADSRLAVTVALGLEAAELSREPSSLKTLVLSAGRFPLRDDPNDLGARWRARHGNLPTWYAALGHDAGALARAALRELPLGATEDPREIQNRHEALSRSLLGVQADLWTTDGRSFGGGHSLARTLHVIEATPQ